MFKNYQKGVSLYLALMIMFISIAIGLGVSLIIVSQMKMIRGMGDSVIALYIADTGIEHSLYDRRKGGGTGEIPDTDFGGGSYKVNCCGGDCGQDCRESVGSFKIVKRGIEVTGAAPPPPPTFDYDITLDPTSITNGYAHCPTTGPTVTTTLISGEDRSITFYEQKVSGPGIVSIDFAPSGCVSLNNCSSETTITVSLQGFYVIEICGDTDILDKCAEFTYDVPSTGPPCPL